MGVSAGGIGERLAAVRERIALACERSGRDPGEVRLIAVSKGQPAEAVIAALAHGQVDFGENRVQEALGKMAAVAEATKERGLPRPVWHLIGHLQSNKVRAVAGGGFAILHGIDSLRLLEMVDRAAAPVQPVLLEVNVAGEATKFGVAPEQVGEAPEQVGAIVARARELAGVRLCGLMTVAPRVADPEEVRPVFRALRELAERHGLAELSMGMTDDFEVAIEEGATMVRIGRALFGERG